MNGAVSTGLESLRAPQHLRCAKFIAEAASSLLRCRSDQVVDHEGTLALLDVIWNEASAALAEIQNEPGCSDAANYARAIVECAAASCALVRELRGRAIDSRELLAMWAMSKEQATLALEAMGGAT